MSQPTQHLISRPTQPTDPDLLRNAVRYGLSLRAGGVEITSVKAGALLLDEVVPGWAQEGIIDLDLLSITSEHWCALAQLERYLAMASQAPRDESTPRGYASPFRRAAEMLGLLSASTRHVHDSNEDDHEREWLNVKALGFDLPNLTEAEQASIDEMESWKDKQEYHRQIERDLNGAWKEQIQFRRDLAWQTQKYTELQSELQSGDTA